MQQMDEPDTTKDAPQTTSSYLKEIPDSSSLGWETRTDKEVLSTATHHCLAEKQSNRRQQKKQQQQEGERCCSTKSYAKPDTCRCLDCHPAAAITTDRDNPGENIEVSTSASRPKRPPLMSPAGSQLHDTRNHVKARLDASISNLQLQCNEWVNLHGLVSCAVEKLGKVSCIDISELGHGSHNSLYHLFFSDGTSCAASIVNAPPLFFSADAKRSEIATMQYLYQSPLYTIPIPQVYAWDLTFDNPVGAPYVLREVVQGTNLSVDGRFYKLDHKDKMKVIKELAFVQAALSQKTEFDKIGCIYQNEDGLGFHVGKLVSVTKGPEDDEEEDSLLGPYETITELWQAKIEREVLVALRSWSMSDTDGSVPDSTGLPASNARPQEFGELLQLLSGLTELFVPPKELSTLCIQHADFALRNVLFDEKTFKITGVIDWEYASVVPLAVTGRFPNDLGWEGNEFAQSLGKLGNLTGVVWNHHYYDWTSLSGVTPPDPHYLPSPPQTPANPDECRSPEDYLTLSHLGSRTSSTPSTPVNGEGQSEEHESQMASTDILSPPSPPLPPPPTSETSQHDLNTRGARLVKLFYFRKYYASRVAARNVALTRMFMDSVAYIKFNEVVMGGAEKWFAAAEWIREVFWRMNSVNKDTKQSLQRGEQVVRVPEVFEIEAERGVVDLGDWEKRLKIVD